MRLTNLADVLRSAGLKVEEVPGWKTRGTEMTDVQAIICHHTAGPASGNYPSLGTVRNGRPGIPGPLSQLGLGRDGTWFVIASGRANHAGITSKSWQTSSHSIGIEAEAQGTGVKADWPAVQMRSYERGVAALAKAYRVPIDRVLGHKEIAAGHQGGPVNGRKIDPSFNMNTFRAAVAAGPEREEPDMDATQAKQLSEIRALIGELHTGIAPQIPTSATRDPEWINFRAAVRDIRIAVTRQLDDAVATGVATALDGVTGVDKAALTKGVVAEVRKALDAVGDTQYFLTPKES